MARRSRATGNPRGRPRQTDEDRLDSLVSFRVNAASFDRLTESAKRRAMSPSEFARALVEKAIGEEFSTMVNIRGRRIKVRR